MKTSPFILLGFSLLLSSDAIARSQSLDAEITAAELRIANRNKQITSLQAEADRVFAVAEGWRVPMLAKLTKEQDGYDSTCAGKRVYGSQIGYCENWKARIEEMIDAANKKAQDYKDEWEAAKRRAQDMRNAVAADSAQLQELKQRKEIQRDSNVLGTTTNPSAPSLTASPAPTPATGTDTKAGDQLLSAAATAKANGDLKINYDKGGAQSAGSLVIPSPKSQTPGAMELARHIPEEAKQDEEIQRSMAYYQKLDGQKIATQNELAAVQRQLDNHAGDATVLRARRETLGNDLRRYEGDQGKVMGWIKERLVSIGKKWDESPTPATDGNRLQ